MKTYLLFIAMSSPAKIRNGYVHEIEVAHESLKNLNALNLDSRLSKSKVRERTRKARSGEPLTLDNPRKLAKVFGLNGCKEPSLLQSRVVEALRISGCYSNPDILSNNSASEL